MSDWISSVSEEHIFQTIMDCIEVLLINEKKKKKEEDCFLQRAMLDPVSPFLSFGGKESCAEGSPLYKIRYTVINAISAVGFQGG